MDKFMNVSQTPLIIILWNTPKAMQTNSSYNFSLTVLKKDNIPLAVFFIFYFFKVSAFHLVLIKILLLISHTVRHNFPIVSLYVSRNDKATTTKQLQKLSGVQNLQELAMNLCDD